MLYTDSLIGCNHIWQGPLTQFFFVNLGPTMKGSVCLGVSVGGREIIFIQEDEFELLVN